MHDPLARSAYAGIGDSFGYADYGVAAWLQTIGSALKTAAQATGKGAKVAGKAVGKGARGAGQVIGKGAKRGGQAFATLDPATQALILTGAGQAVGSGISRVRSNKCARLERKMARAQRKGNNRAYSRYYSQYQTACAEALSEDVMLDPGASGYGASPGAPPWLLPLAIGGGVLVLAMVLTGGKRRAPARAPAPRGYA